MHSINARTLEYEVVSEVLCNLSHQSSKRFFVNSEPACLLMWVAVVKCLLGILSGREWEVRRVKELAVAVCLLLERLERFKVT